MVFQCLSAFAPHCDRALQIIKGQLSGFNAYRHSPLIVTPRPACRLGRGDVSMPIGIRPSL